MTCPTCESTDPNKHPAVQADGGEVQPCRDAFHLGEPGDPCDKCRHLNANHRMLAGAGFRGCRKRNCSCKDFRHMPRSSLHEPGELCMRDGCGHQYGIHRMSGCRVTDCRCRTFTDIPPSRPLDFTAPNTRFEVPKRWIDAEYQEKTVQAPIADREAEDFARYYNDIANRAVQNWNASHPEFPFDATPWDAMPEPVKQILIDAARMWLKETGK